MEVLSILLALLFYSFIIPVSKFIASKTKEEWKDNQYPDLLKVILMMVILICTLCMSIYTSTNLWYGFFIGVSLGYFWRGRHSPFLGALFGTILFFNSILYSMLTILTILILTYGPKFRHLDFLFFISSAVLFAYINVISIDLTIFNLAATGGGIGGLMINEVGVLWKKMKKKRK